MSAGDVPDRAVTTPQRVEDQLPLWVRDRRARTRVQGVGIPLTSGFVSKYARVTVTMFFNEPGPQTPTAMAPARPTAVAAAATVLLGIAPQPLFDLATQAGPFLR